MARSATQVAKSIADDMLAANPMVDVTKGPFYDLAITPPANEVSAVEAEADRITTLYSRFADRPGTLASAEIAALGRAFKVATPNGTKSKVLVTFYMTTLPQTAMDIPVGLPVASADGVYVFVTTTAVLRVDSSTAGAHLDASSGRYLFNVEAEAVAVGGGYNLPAYRITKMLMPVPGVAGVYNAVPSMGGSSPDQTQNYLSSVQDAFLARDTSMLSGLALDIQRRGVNQQIQLVDSTQRDSFYRPVSSSAVDVYMIDPVPDTNEDIFAANAASVYQLSKKPVLSIDAVYVNGTPQASTAYTFSPDTSPAYRRSAFARDAVRLSFPLTASDIVRIRYTYGSAAWNLQTGFGEADIMGADVMARLTNPLYISVAADIVCPASSLAAITVTTQAFLTSNFGTTFHSSDVSTYLQSVYPEIQMIRWSVFALRSQTGVTTIAVPFGFSLAFKSGADLQLRTVGV